jgi:hypothetical protein
MTTAAYNRWVNDGRPYRDCQPGIDIRDTLGKRHGLVVYSYPDERHLKAATPEDHTPFSHTPYPGAQPYPYGRAVDIMPDDDVCDWRALGEQIIADIDAGVPGTETIAYVNYTTRSGRCLHVEYEPHKAVSTSSDTGHIHISFRTDFVTSHAMADYDPVARLLGDDMPTTPADVKVITQTDGVIHNFPWAPDIATNPTITLDQAVQRIGVTAHDAAVRSQALLDRPAVAATLADADREAITASVLAGVVAALPGAITAALTEHPLVPRT